MASAVVEPGGVGCVVANGSVPGSMWMCVLPTNVVGSQFGQLVQDKLDQCDDEKTQRAGEAVQRRIDREL